MASYGQSRDPVRLLWRRLGVLALIILIVFGVRGVWGAYNKEKESRVLRIEAEAKLRDLELRESQLRADIAELKTERGVEGVLRERYDVAKEGEGVIVIVDQSAPPPQPKPTTYQRFKNWLVW